jgi:hypothetical protein
MIFTSFRVDLLSYQLAELFRVLQGERFHDWERSFAQEVVLPEAISESCQIVGARKLGSACERA